MSPPIPPSRPAARAGGALGQRHLLDRGHVRRQRPRPAGAGGVLLAQFRRALLGFGLVAGERGLDSSKANCSLLVGQPLRTWPERMRRNRRQVLDCSFRSASASRSATTLSRSARRCRARPKRPATSPAVPLGRRAVLRRIATLAHRHAAYAATVGVGIRLPPPRAEVEPANRRGELHADSRTVPSVTRGQRNAPPSSCFQTSTRPLVSRCRILSCHPASTEDDTTPEKDPRRAPRPPAPPRGGRHAGNSTAWSPDAARNAGRMVIMTPRRAPRATPRSAARIRPRRDPHHRPGQHRPDKRLGRGHLGRGRLRHDRTNAASPRLASTPAARAFAPPGAQLCGAICQRRARRDHRPGRVDLRHHRALSPSSQTRRRPGPSDLDR